MKYRREIDGLRAVAVLPVIFYHAGFSAFGGGFVGVDIFFVISGYLITTIILSEMEKESFSIVNFYERRARRILPALFFVMICCLPFAWLWLLPRDLQNFSQSLVAVSVFSSNVLYWLQSGYFDTGAELRVLLHTWSLAVEEQYYLFFPLFLMCMWKFRKRWILVSLFCIAMASLSLTQWGVGSNPSMVFYLLPTRMWELLIGVAVAFYFLYKNQRKNLLFDNKIVFEFLGACGFLLIVYSIVTFDNKTPFPSSYALIPTIGTASIILFADDRTLVGKLLGTRPLVGIGLISYSAYLWHQPLFVFARHRSLSEPRTPLLLALSVLSIFLAWVSWKYVESPFRNKKIVSRKQVFRFAITGSLVFLLVGLSGHFSKGFLGRNLNPSLHDDYLSKVLAAPYNIGKDGTRCVSNMASMCQFEEADNDIHYLLVGDSHSADFSAEFAQYVKSEGANGWQMSVGGCGMLNSQSQGHESECGKATKIFEESLKSGKYDKIFYISRLISALPEEILEEDIERIVKIVGASASNGSKIYFFKPRPVLNTETPLKNAQLGALDDIHVLVESGQSEKMWDDAIVDLSHSPNIVFFDQRKTLEALGGSEEGFNGHDEKNYPLYRDEDHLTAYGAGLVWREFLNNKDLLSPLHLTGSRL